MGRWGTGATTTKEALRIELSFLLRQGFIRKGCIIEGVLSWNNGSKIGIESFYTKEERCLKLRYCLENNETGEKENCEYTIQFRTIPSNLGRGEIVYFGCPITGSRARILYKCYGSKIWKSRGAYRHRIYYPSQQCSKFYYHIERYFALEKELDECYQRSKKSHYRGKETRLLKRINILTEQKSYHDYARFIIVPRFMQKLWNPESLEFAKRSLKR